MLYEKFRRNIGAIAEKYFVDNSSDYSGSTQIEHFKLVLLGLSYLLRNNILLTGEPGFGKTTAAKVILSSLSGLPFDLYESTQIQGHPEQTEEKMLSRPDYSKLQREEAVVWQPSLYLPGFIVDEINRLPQGKQDILLNAIDTGRFNYLGHTLYFGRRPFYATANYMDENGSLLIPPLLDRFAINIELGRTGERERIRKARENIEKLKDPEITTAILTAVQDKSSSDVKKLELFASYAKKFGKILKNQGLEPFCPEEFDGVRLDIPLTPEAQIFLDCIDAELNSSNMYGLKRRSDPMDDSTHAKGIASSRIKNSFSPRALLALEDFSKALAAYLGSKETQKEHVICIAPYVIAHRIEPTEDFKAEYTGKPRLRGEHEGLDLARRLLENTEKNFKSVYQTVSLLQNYILGKKLTQRQSQQAEHLLFREDIINIDHPLLKEIILEERRRK